MNKITITLSCILFLLILGLNVSQSIRAEIDLMGLIMDVKQSRRDA